MMSELDCSAIGSSASASNRSSVILGYVPRRRARRTMTLLSCRDESSAKRCRVRPFCNAVAPYSRSA